MLQLLKWSINKRNLPGHLVILSKKPFLPRLFLLPKKWFLERLKLPLPLPQRQSCQTQLILHPWRYLHSLFHLGAQPAISAPCLCWECRRANPATSILCLKLQWVYSASSGLFFFFFFLAVATWTEQMVCTVPANSTSTRGLAGTGPASVPAGGSGELC